MNKLIKAVLVAFALAVVPRFALAEEYLIPQDANGNIPGDANQYGCDVIDSTSTVGTGLTTPVLLYWVMVSSDAVTNYATLRDTNTINATSNVKMTVFPNGNGGTSITASSTIIPFNPPVIFRNGISIHLNAAPAGSATQGRWHFCVRRRSIGSSRGVDTAFSDTGS